MPRARLVNGNLATNPINHNQILRSLRDSLQGYKVSIKDRYLRSTNQITIVLLLSLELILCMVYCADINECEGDIYPCHESATCKNTDGSFNCECKEGYIGDGFYCAGKTKPGHVS